jgi:hypothetical protein
VDEGAAELTGRFLNTFIATQRDNVLLPIYVRAIVSTDKQAKTILISGTMVDPVSKDWIPMAHNFKESSLDYFPPKPGMRNIGTSAVFYDIFPLRHKYRGLRREQISCSYFDPKVEVENSIESASFQYSLFNPQYMSVDAALELVGKKKRVAAAFSHKFAVLRSRHFKHNVFVYKKMPFAVYSKNDHSAVLPVGSHHLIEELSLYINCIKDNK